MLQSTKKRTIYSLIVGLFVFYFYPGFSLRFFLFCPELGIDILTPLLCGAIAAVMSMAILSLFLIDKVAMILLTIWSIFTFLGDLLFFIVVINLLSTVSRGWCGTMISNLEAICFLLVPITILQAIVAHAFRDRISVTTRILVFVPWGIGVGLIIASCIGGLIWPY